MFNFSQQKPLVYKIRLLFSFWKKVNSYKYLINANGLTKMLIIVSDILKIKKRTAKKVGYSNRIYEINKKRARRLNHLLARELFITSFYK
jgi:hypothetical protein